MPHYAIILTDIPGDVPRKNVFGPHRDYASAETFVTGRLKLPLDIADIRDLPFKTSWEVAEYLNQEQTEQITGEEGKW